MSGDQMNPRASDRRSFCPGPARCRSRLGLVEKVYGLGDRPWDPAPSASSTGGATPALNPPLACGDRIRSGRLVPGHHHGIHGDLADQGAVLLTILRRDVQEVASTEARDSEPLRPRLGRERHVDTCCCDVPDGVAKVMSAAAAEPPSRYFTNATTAIDRLTADPSVPTALMAERVVTIDQPFGDCVGGAAIYAVTATDADADATWLIAPADARSRGPASTLLRIRTRRRLGCARDDSGHPTVSRCSSARLRLCFWRRSGHRSSTRR